MKSEAKKGPGRRFIIVGLPRSGTTYLMTLLNAHKDVICAGELFNPYAVVEHDDADYDLQRIFDRDKAPRYFCRQYFEKYEQEPWARIGFKLMLGHNIRLLTWLQEMEDVSILYVHRNNRLAQVASYLKALQTKKWAQTSRTPEMKKRIIASPQQISHHWHEYAAMDFLFQQWLKTLPGHKLWIEYREMFKPDFNSRLCDFLAIPADPKMKSPLVKQGLNRVIDRFENPGPIEAYVRHLGYPGWLDDELAGK